MTCCYNNVANIMYYHMSLAKVGISNLQALNESHNWHTSWKWKSWWLTMNTLHK